MKAADVVFIRTVFNLQQRDLAKAMNVSPATVARWESSDNVPTGLQEEVLRALHNVAIDVETDEAQKRLVGGLIALGIGAVLFYLLTRR